MRAILVALCLLLTALAFAPQASADDQSCIGDPPGVVVCHYTNADGHTCTVFGVGNPSSGVGVCTFKDAQGLHVCYFGDGQEYCLVHVPTP